MAVDESPTNAAAAHRGAPASSGSAPDGAAPGGTGRTGADTGDGPGTAGGRAARRERNRGGDALDVLPGDILDWLTARRLVDRDRRHANSPERVLHELVAEQRRQLGQFHRGLDAVQGLLRLVADPQTSGRMTVEAEYFTDRARLRQRLYDLDVLCQGELLCMRGTFPEPEDLADSLEADLAMLARGVTIRLLVSAGAARRPGASRFLTALSDHGAEIRLAPTVPLQLNIVDRRTTVLALHLAEDGTGPPEDILFHSTRLALCFARVFEHHWDVSLPYGRQTGRGEPAEEWTPREREILALLASGAKDEAIARRLGCSERTLRRLLAALVRRLGAESRFAAGVRAARLGLLDGS
ncbi:LuxR C-terminal-related transcriptional regulator [Streptomyces uncialis]|uniref:helix-turn-helix transcriptional regulator n=1 Tax=Streptomyces uncialis TaxID=1048205 RepID=UPI00365CF5D2